MEFLADIAGGSGIFGTLFGAIGGIASAVVKLKTLKEQNRHAFIMAELAGNQEIAVAEAELRKVETEGAIAAELKAEESLQASFQHDASIGAWLQSQELGPITRGIMVTAEFVRMMMRPVLTVAAVIYTFRMYGGYFDLATAAELDKAILEQQLTMIASAILLLATTAFTWWFADRSVSKALQKKLA